MMTSESSQCKYIAVYGLDARPLHNLPWLLGGGKDGAKSDEKRQITLTEQVKMVKLTVDTEE